MLRTQPRLFTRRPSPTTVEYLVSTSPTYNLPLWLLFIATILIRITVGVTVLLLLYLKFAFSGYSFPAAAPPRDSGFLGIEYIRHLLYEASSSDAGLQCATLAAQIPVYVLLPVCLAVLYSILLRTHTTESLLVLRGLGIQTSSSSDTYLSTATTRFIPTEKIQDIFVNEAFRGFEVRYYLVVVVEGEEDVVVVFPKLLPRIHIVEKVWRGARACLYEADWGKERKEG
jgi:phosphatidylinositol glycan class H protein